MIVAIIQARMSSSRLPGKVLKKVLGRPLLSLQLERIKRAKKIDEIILATSTDPSDQPLEDLGKQEGVKVFRGSLADVLDRFYQASQTVKADHVVRLTGDCPLADPSLIDAVIQFHVDGKFEYTSNVLKPTYPDGLDIEVMKMSVLKEAWQNAKLPSEREHVTPYCYKGEGRYRLGSYQGEKDFSSHRWTVDQEEDFKLVSQIFTDLYPISSTFNFKDVLAYLELKPELSSMNSKIVRNEGYQKSLQMDK